METNPSAILELVQHFEDYRPDTKLKAVAQRELADHKVASKDAPIVQFYTMANPI